MKQLVLKTYPVGAEVDGVEITYDKHKKTLIIGGFYDRVCPIETTEITLESFLSDLGIDKADISFAFRRGKV